MPRLLKKQWWEAWLAASSSARDLDASSRARGWSSVKGLEEGPKTGAVVVVVEEVVVACDCDGADFLSCEENRGSELVEKKTARVAVGCGVEVYASRGRA